MPRATRAFFERVAAETERKASTATTDRASHGAWAAVCDLVRERLERVGIDPAGVRALQLAPHHDPLPASGVRGTAEEFTISDGDSLAGSFAEKIGRIAARYADGQQPDFANASLAELLAWCLAVSAQS